MRKMTIDPNRTIHVRWAGMRASVQDYVWIPDSLPRYRDVWLVK